MPPATTMRSRCCERHKHVQARRGDWRSCCGIDPTTAVTAPPTRRRCAGLGDHERALPLYRELLADATPEDPELHLSIAHSLKTLGRPAGGHRGVPRRGGARRTTATPTGASRTSRPIASRRARSRACAPTRRPPTPGWPTAITCASRSARRSRTAASTPSPSATTSAATRSRRRESRYRPSLIERNARLQAGGVHARVLRRAAGCRLAGAERRFSSSACRARARRCIEQILASHSQVEGTWSWPIFRGWCRSCRAGATDTTSPRYPAGAGELDPREIAQRLGEKYLADTRVYRTGKPFFIDKMPNNFRHLGLIHLILPNARIIDARREPMACCFSNFKQLFATARNSPTASRTSAATTAPTSS